MNIRESAEDYLEMILMLSEKKGEVRSIDIAAGLGPNFLLYSSLKISSLNLLTDVAHLPICPQ